MLKPPPMVTVLISFFNAEKYLALAIESVLSQTYSQFELILIDDGSVDASNDIAAYYARRDARIILIRQGNEGMGEALNRGLRMARAEWIIRMDGDDIMLPNRIERQLAFVEEHPEISIGSSYVYYINSCNRRVGQSRSEFITHESVAKAYQSGRLVGFTHPAVIMRKSVIERVGGYRKQFWPAEDIDLWNRVLEQGEKILVQPEWLLEYRIHEGSVSVGKAVFAAEQVSWIKESLRARRAGKQEPNREQFEEMLEQRPLHLKIRSFRKAYSKAYYKAATTAWANGGRAKAVFDALVAGILDPKLLVGKFKIRSFGVAMTFFFLRSISFGLEGS